MRPGLRGRRVLDCETVIDNRRGAENGSGNAHDRESIAIWIAVAGEGINADGCDTRLRCVGRRDRRTIRQVVEAVKTKPAECIDGKHLPFCERIEHVRAIGVAADDLTAAAQRLVERSNSAALPCRARIGANLTDHIKLDTISNKHDRIVAVEQERFNGAITRGSAFPCVASSPDRTL